MFDPSRDEVRRFFCEAWRKQREAAPLTPLEAIAARTLLVHEWRRIVLRDPGLPERLLPRDWPGAATRDLARGIYRALAGPSEAWLDAAGVPPLTDTEGFARRWES